MNKNKIEVARKRKRNENQRKTKKKPKRNTTKRNESKAKQNELDEYHHHLEDLIKERTKDLELMKEKAEEAIEIKSEFLSNITHELRTPLHAILSFARIGKQRAETIPADKIQEFFDDIHVSGNRLLVLVNNLLDLSKADAGKIVLEKRSHDMKVTIDQALKELSILMILIL